MLQLIIINGQEKVARSQARVCPRGRRKVMRVFNDAIRMVYVNGPPWVAVDR